MKKWSILTSLVVFAALAVASFATVGAASADNYHPYCPSGEEGTPPYCHPPVGGGGGGGGGGTGGGGGGGTGGGGTGGGGGGGGGGTSSCPTGQVGTPPNCVTPTINVNEIVTQPNSSTVTFKVNAPGKVKVSGKGVASTTVSVTPGKVKVKVKLTKAAKEELKEKGHLTLKVKVTYTPKGGTPITKIVKVTFKSQPEKGGKGHKGHK
jgi:hypothetical protein